MESVITASALSLLQTPLWRENLEVAFAVQNVTKIVRKKMKVLFIGGVMMGIGRFRDRLVLMRNYP